LSWIDSTQGYSCGFFEAIDEHEALERLIAGKTHFAELAAYPGRADLPPVFRV